MHPGVIGMSAPVFDIDGDIIATINLAGMDGVLDTRPQSAARRVLRSAAADLSHQLGRNSTA